MLGDTHVHVDPEEIQLDTFNLGSLGRILVYELKVKCSCLYIYTLIRVHSSLLTWKCYFSRPSVVELFH